MTPADAARLLAVAAIYDRRTIGETEARAWAADLDDVDLDQAVAAVREHYTASPDVWLRPGHVRAVVRRHRRHRLERSWLAEQHALAEVDADGDRAGYRAALHRVRRDMAAAPVQRAALPPPRCERDETQRRNRRGRARCEAEIAAATRQRSLQRGEGTDQDENEEREQQP